jgi:hypothetical protein
MKACINCSTKNPDDAVLCCECGMSLRRSATGDEAIKLKQLGMELEAESRPELEPPPPGETPTAQSRLAYRVAAVLLFVGASLRIPDVILSSGTLSAAGLAGIVVDVALGIALLRLSGGARLVVLVRAVFGAIIVPVLAFGSFEPLTAMIWTAMQLGISIALALLLTGQSKTWRIALALSLFLVFTLGTFTVFLLLMALASLMGF